LCREAGMSEQIILPCGKHLEWALEIRKEDSNSKKREVISGRQASG